MLAHYRLPEDKRMDTIRFTKIGELRNPWEVQAAFLTKEEEEALLKEDYGRNKVYAERNNSDKEGDVDG